MKKNILFLICCLLTSFISQAAVDEYYKHAIQRGYSLRGDSVIFPDKSTCLYKDFAEGRCGQKWMTTDYCVEEGKMVWDKDKCCEGLAPFLPDDTDGQMTCEKMDKIKNIDGYQSKMIWFALIFPVLLLIIAVMMFIMRRRARRNQNL